MSDGNLDLENFGKKKKKKKKALNLDELDGAVVPEITTKEGTEGGLDDDNALEVSFDFSMSKHS